MPKALELELKRRARKLARAGKLRVDEGESHDDALEKAKNRYIYGTLSKIKKKQRGAAR